jgi:hypothetical protein
MKFVYVVQKNFYIAQHSLSEYEYEAQNFNTIDELIKFLNEREFDLTTCLVQHNVSYKAQQRYYLSYDLNMLTDTTDDALKFDDLKAASDFMIVHKLSNYIITPVLI